MGLELVLKKFIVVEFLIVLYWKFDFFISFFSVWICFFRLLVVRKVVMLVVYEDIVIRIKNRNLVVRIF